MAKTDITRVASRNALPPRREPYFARLGRGRALGYRAGSDTWIARLTLTGSTVKTYCSLGDFAQLPPTHRYQAALDAATAWFGQQTPGQRDKGRDTVGEAVLAYADYLDQMGRSSADVRFRYKESLDGHRLARISLAALTPEEVLRWRRDLGVGKNGQPSPPATINRKLTFLRAALNHAQSSMPGLSNYAWKIPLKSQTNANRARRIALTKTQRQQFVESLADNPALQDFMRVYCALPIRIGALYDVRVRDYHPEHGTLTIVQDKAGAGRVIQLPEAISATLTKLARGKGRTDFLFSTDGEVRWTDSHMSRQIKARMAKAGMPDGSTAYAVRHGVLTDMIVAGTPLALIAELGGTSEQMLRAHYSKAISRPESRTALEGLL